MSQSQDDRSQDDQSQDDQSRDARFVMVEPVEGGKVPVPGQARFLSRGDRVDCWDAYWAQLLRDGSIRRLAAEADPAPPESSASEQHAADPL